MVLILSRTCDNKSMAYKMNPKSPLLQDMPQFKSKVKKRGDKTIVKTKEKGSNYRSKIVLDDEGNVIKKFIKANFGKEAGFGKEQGFGKESSFEVKKE